MSPGDWRKPLTALWLLAFTALLAGCGFKMPWNDDPPPTCPAVRLLQNADTEVVYAPGAARDPVDVRFSAKFAQLDWACTYELEEDSPYVQVDLTINFAITRGPADQNRQADFRYFVAALDADRNVVDKQVFPVSIRFPPTLDRVGMPEPDSVTLRLPLSRSMPGWRYTVVAGFQLTEQELEEQRAKSR